MRSLFSCFLLFFVLSSYAQKKATHSLLQSGPMVGYSTMREVLLWVQTKESAKVHFEYWDINKPTEKFKTQSYQTLHSEGYTARLIAEVLPSTKYSYQLFIDNKPVPLSYPTEFQSQVLWRWRTEPPTFKFAVGSCFYVNEERFDRPGRGYGDGYRIIDSIYNKKPDFMLWLGDNIYLREVDFDSRTGFIHRYTHTRSLPNLQPFLASIHQYAIWDDHDFGPNDSDGSYIFKDLASEMFRLFWGNLTYGIANNHKGITSSFYWADVDFFLLDNRYFKTPNSLNSEKREMFGEEQIDWLIQALSYSKAPFKIVAAGGQIINSAAIFENYATYSQEREMLFKRIREAKIEGVIFLSGDRHHTELSVLQENESIYPIYDFTISPLTSGTHTQRDENNSNLVANTTINDKNYGLFEVLGTQENRIIKIQIYTIDGKMVWEKQISANELKYTK